jgi:hypothetical protein
VNNRVRIEKLLSVGDLRSAGNSEKVVDLVLSRPKLFNDVVDAIFSDYAGTKMRASDAIEKITRIHPEYLKPYKKVFLSKVSEIDQKEVRWHTAQILPRLTLTKKEREKVYSLMMLYLKDESSIVRTFAMQALADIAMLDKTYIPKVKKLIGKLVKDGSPAMQSRGRKLLVILNNEQS